MTATNLWRFLVTDYNGTLACDGALIPEVIPLIRALATGLEVHVVTADTFGDAARNLQMLPAKLTILPLDRQDQGKADLSQATRCGVYGMPRQWQK